jgi:CHAD domain-containing protein
MKKPEVRSVPDESIRNGIEEIDELLNKTAYRIRFHQLHNLNAITLLNQLELSYNAVSVIYMECRNKVNPEKIHEFRKRSKDFLYQLFFFRPLNPSVVRSVEKRIEKLTLSLGRYNDLYQLIKALGYTYSPESLNPSMDTLIIKIREKQDLALSQVWPAAYKCFSPGTKLVNLLGFKLLVI